MRLRVRQISYFCTVVLTITSQWLFEVVFDALEGRTMIRLVVVSVEAIKR